MLGVTYQEVCSLFETTEQLIPLGMSRCDDQLRPSCTCQIDSSCSSVCALCYQLHCTVTSCNARLYTAINGYTLQHTATHCDALYILQHTAAHCSMLQHIARLQNDRSLLLFIGMWVATHPHVGTHSYESHTSFTRVT